MSVDPLFITSQPNYDDRITGIEIHTYNPYANASLGNNDEIRIPIQQQDLITLPCESYLYVEGFLIEGTRAAGSKAEDIATLDNNAGAFLFDEIRYELNGIEIDQCKNVGITTGMKNLALLTQGESRSLANAGWTLSYKAMSSNKFNFCIPLRMLLGFCEDYKRVIVNSRHELVLIGARNDVNSIISTKNITNSRLTLEKIQWRMPHLKLNEIAKLQFLRIIEKDEPITMAFRSWDLYEYPLLPETSRHAWTVKTATQLEKPRYVILALRQNKKTTQQQPSMKFSDCKLSDVKLYLNSEFYPYDRLNLNFDKDQYSLLYDMYIKFMRSYYAGTKVAEPLLDYKEFTTYGPLIPIDCSHQNDSIKSGTVDVKIEIECKENIPSNTTAYCLIIHDRIIEYNPLTSNVRKLI